MARIKQTGFKQAKARQTAAEAEPVAAVQETKQTEAVVPAKKLKKKRNKLVVPIVAEAVVEESATTAHHEPSDKSERRKGKKKRKRSSCEGVSQVQAPGAVEGSEPAPDAKKTKTDAGGEEETEPACATPPPLAKPSVDVAAEIQRVLAAESPEAVLNLAQGESDEGVVSQEWKRLVLLLHPDKLQNVDAETREAGAQALHLVHNAKEEMKLLSQEVCAEVPVQPLADGRARLLEKDSGSRKYEINWKIPDCQDPKRPVEKYEIWGPKYFSDAGDAFDWVLLAALPPLQQHFVIVEESPTQQDVMWAGDRIRRETLPLSVHAVNGKGSSEALTFEMPWSTVFPWLQGMASVLCPRCCQLTQRKGAYSSCGGCTFRIPAENTIVVRCPDCQGEVRWLKGGAQLSCCCCFKVLGGAFAQAKGSKGAPKGGPPLRGGGGGASGGRPGLAPGGRRW